MSFRYVRQEVSCSSKASQESFVDWSFCLVLLGLTQAQCIAAFPGGALAEIPLIASSSIFLSVCSCYGRAHFKASHCLSVKQIQLLYPDAAVQANQLQL